MTQAELGRIADLSTEAIASYENLRVVPPLHVKIRLSVILGVPMDELFPSEDKQ